MKMTLTRLLNEIKLANNKIDKKLRENVNYFDIMASGKLKNYKSEEDMKAKVTAHLDSITDLIKLRDRYRALLLNANNTTKLTVNGQELTIAEAIAKKESIKQEQSLVKIIRVQLQSMEASVVSIDNNNESKLDSIIVSAMGKDKKTDGSEIESITKAFRENNKVTLIDAGGAKKFLEDKEEEIEKFISDIDFSLSEINAKTEVETEPETTETKGRSRSKK